MTNYEVLRNEYANDDYICAILNNLEEDGCDADEAEEIIEDGRYRIYEDCADMSDVAYYVADEMGWLDTDAGRYFDFAMFGRDLDIEGTFYQLDYHTIAEIIW